MPLTDKAKQYLEAKGFAHIATINKDGSPQVSPVWIEHDGTRVIVNSEDKRLKVQNLRRNPHVSLSIQNVENPYEYIEIRGKVVEITPEGGFEGIDRLAKKYIGQDKYPWNQPEDVRVQIKIEPTRIVGA
ncbi:MAG: PPOX class F420-dependent oxidoreductase [Chloroflexi bacterium]|nr:PPOX class F420-dependent oxidoreductase [Chloroflexota bacterium]